MPGRGLLPAQPLPGSGGGGAQQSAADGPLASWARRLGVRAGRLQPCAGAGTAPRPAPGSGVPAPRSEGLPVLAPPACTRTGAGTRVSEEKTRRKNATASWNTFPCLERKRSEEREGEKKKRVSWNHMVASHRQPLPRSLARSLLPPSQRSWRAGRRPGSRGGRRGSARGGALCWRPRGGAGVRPRGGRCGIDPVGENRGHLGHERG